MNYRRFLAFNVVGGVGWVVSMVLIGYSLSDVLKKIFGDGFKVEKHIEKVVILVVLLSISPGIIPLVSRPPTTTVFSIRAAGGSSHSNVTPTRSSPSPSAYTISVAEGSRDTTRTRPA